MAAIALCVATRLAPAACASLRLIDPDDRCLVLQHHFRQHFQEHLCGNGIRDNSRVTNRRPAVFIELPEIKEKLLRRESDLEIIGIPAFQVSLHRRILSSPRPGWSGLASAIWEGIARRWPWP